MTITAVTAVPDARMVDAGSVRLHVLDWPGEGETVLLLPGAGQSAHIFRELVPLLGRGLRVVAVTPRGHGESDTPAHGYRVAQLAADAAGVMDALEMGRAAVVAHSLGGAVATRLAADAPDRVSRVVYLDSLTDYAGLGRMHVRNPARPPLLPPEADDAAQRTWHREYVYRVWNAAVEADWKARPEREVAMRRRELLAELLDDVASHPEPFSAVRCPALALMASESMRTQFWWMQPDDPRCAAARAYLHEVRGPWRRAAAERFRREVPHSRVAEIPGNHFFFLTEPGQTAAEIRAFLHST